MQWHDLIPFCKNSLEVAMLDRDQWLLAGAPNIIGKYTMMSHFGSGGGSGGVIVGGGGGGGGSVGFKL